MLLIESSICGSIAIIKTSRAPKSAVIVDIPNAITNCRKERFTLSILKYINTTAKISPIVANKEYDGI